MRLTGRIHPLTGEEIYQVEEDDINFWHKEWNELSLSQKADFLSFLSILFLNESNESEVITQYNKYRKKNSNVILKQ